MLDVETLILRLARRVGGPRVLALPIIRLLAIVAGYAWIGLEPRVRPGWDAVDTVMLAFLLYSVGLMVMLWIRPGRMLALNVAVLAVDLAFALLLIKLTGGVNSTLFFALLLIAGLQSYYYGLGRGVMAAAVSAGAYVAVAWPTATSAESADVVVRLVVLIGTAVGLGVLADVEDRERAQVSSLSDEARMRERFIQGVIESLGEGLVVLDPEGRIVTWNQAMEARYGEPATDVIGRHLFDVKPAFKEEALAEALQRLLRGEVEAITLEAMEHQSVHRGPVTLNIKGTLLRRGGQPTGAVLLLEDITERVGLERAARQAEKLAGLGTLAAGLAHELNNPIGIISSRIELMLLESADALPQELREDLGVLHRHAQRVAKIVQGLLSFSRQSAGARHRVDLNRVVDDTMLLVEKQIAKDGIRLERRLTAGLPPIVGDANALEQVLVNLVLNARDAIATSGEIVVSTDRAPDHPGRIRVIVHDTGPGIPPEILPRIFDPFFTTKTSGTGLGLSLSYGIVREHQGSVDVESTPGRGTTFILTFPVEVSGAPA